MSEARETAWRMETYESRLGRTLQFRDADGWRNWMSFGDDELACLRMLEVAHKAEQSTRLQARNEALEEAAALMDDWPCRASAIRELKE